MTLRPVPHTVNVPLAIRHIGVTAVTFTVLGLVIGFTHAAFFVAAAAILTVLIWLCRRVPVVGAFVLLVFCNLLSGGRWR
jgi:hypothetical protein